MQVQPSSGVPLVQGFPPLPLSSETVEWVPACAVLLITLTLAPRYWQYLTENARLITEIHTLSEGDEKNLAAEGLRRRCLVVLSWLWLVGSLSNVH